MAGDALLWLGAIAAGGAVGLLRFSWGQARRSLALNAAAWALLAAGLALGALEAGAWGVAVASIVATLSAFLLLAYAALAAPPGKAAASNRRANMLPEQGEPLNIGGRLLTFLVTVPVAFLVSVLIGLAGRILADRGGAHPADSNALMLMLMPLAWTLLATGLLMWPARRAQLAVLLVPGLVCSGLLAMSLA